MVLRDVGGSWLVRSVTSPDAAGVVAAAGVLFGAGAISAGGPFLAGFGEGIICSGVQVLKSHCK